MRRLQTGKLPHELLKTLLNELKTGEMDPSVDFHVSDGGIA